MTRRIVVKDGPDGGRVVEALDIPAPYFVDERGIEICGGPGEHLHVAWSGCTYTGAVHRLELVRAVCSTAAPLCAQ